VAYELLLTKGPDLMANLCSFEAEPFLRSLFHDNYVGKLKPVVWWTCTKKTFKGVNPGLCDLAIMLLRLPVNWAWQLFTNGKYWKSFSKLFLITRRLRLVFQLNDCVFPKDLTQYLSGFYPMVERINLSR